MSANSFFKQPGWDHVFAAFVAGAREARANPEADETVFGRAADAYTKLIFSEVDPETHRRIGENDWPEVAPPPSAPCPHIRSSGTGEWATNWCALNGPPAAPEPSRTLTQDERDVFDAAERRSTKVVVPEPSEAEVAAAMASLHRAMEPAAWPSEDEITDALRAAAAARTKC